MDPTTRKKRHDNPELPQLKHPFNKQQMQMPLHPPRRSFSIPTHANLASTFFPQYAPPSPLPLSSPLSSTPGSPLTRSSFFTRRPSTSFQYMNSHESSSTLSLPPLDASSPYPSSLASVTFFTDLVSSLEGGDKFSAPFDMDTIDLESENEAMQGHIEELDEEEDGLEDLDENVESSTDESDDNSDTDNDSDGGSSSSEMDLESEYDSIEDLDHTDGSTGLEDTKASTVSTSMALGLFETYRQTANSNHAAVATSIIARHSSISSELSVAWSNRVVDYDDDKDDSPSSHTEQDTLAIEMTSPPVTAPIWSLPFKSPLLETITLEANIPEMEDHGYKSQMVQEDSIKEEDTFEDDVKLDENDEDKENTQNGTTDENNAIMLMEQMEHNPAQDSIQAVEMTLEDAKESIPSPASFIDSQEIEMDAMDEEQTSFTLTTNETDPGSPNPSDQSTRPTSPYSVWSYLEETTKQESGPTSRASTSPLTRTRPEQDTGPSSPSTNSKTICSDSEASSGSVSDSETTPSSPVSPPPYVATLEQEMESNSAMTVPMKITVTRPTTTRLDSRSLKSRMSSALRSGFSAASARASCLTFFTAPDSEAVEDGRQDSAQDEHQPTSGTLELDVQRLHAEITALHQRIDRLEMDRDGMTPSSNKRRGPGLAPVDRNKQSWTVRSMVVMVLKKGLIHAVLVIVVWLVCYKRHGALRMASGGWRYLKRTKQRWINQRARH
ncbi:hypothetical protein BGZ82_001300 [Podila clonocystis]|nr:hypothetical protein BGZ82_001300 [Podila clonocystis]